MSFLYPLGAAVLQAASATLDKATLSIKRVTYKSYNGISFPLIFLFTLIIFLIIKPNLSLNQFTPFLIIIIIASTIISIITNLLYYRALKSDLLSEMQTFSLLSSIPLILLTALIFSEERNPIIILLAIISVGFLVWSHYEHHHLKISRKTLPYFIWIMLIAPFGGIISKILLKTFDPISLQLIRDFIIAIFFIAIFFKAIKQTPKKAYLPLILTNILTTIAWILYFFSYQKSGIIYTVLIFSLEPLLVYLTSIFLLKEKINLKKIIAFVIILIAIALAQII
jgi:drug/metabolite transporter (DMT)-like permease